MTNQAAGVLEVFLVQFLTFDPSHRAPLKRPAPLVLIESGGYASPLALDAFNRAFSTHKSIRLCGSSRSEKGKRYTCDSMHRCVLCSQYRLAERRADLLAGMRSAPDAALVSLTRRHGMASLQENWDTTDAALRQFSKRGDWSRFQKQHSINGYAPAVEVTLSDLGWNVHVHMLVTFARTITPDAERHLREAITTRWSAAVAFVGHSADADRQTFDMCRTGDDRVRVAQYVTKQNLLHRAPDTNHGRYPADLLAEAANGDVDDAQLYGEYLDAAFGRRLIRAYGWLSCTTNANRETS